MNRLQIFPNLNLLRAKTGNFRTKNEYFESNILSLYYHVNRTALHKALFSYASKSERILTDFHL